MRLSQEHRLALKSHFLRELGAECEVMLFGSRVDNSAGGDDVDLLVKSTKKNLTPRGWLRAWKQVLNGCSAVGV